MASASGLSARAPDDDVQANGRMTISNGGHGLIVDGRRLRSERIEIRGRNGETTVNGLTVPGKVIVKRQNGRLLTINELELEDYLKGVVPAEMNASWHPEALKVQAIAARTYAVYQLRQNGSNGKKDFDVLASTKDQVYRGRAGADGPGGRAVEQTRDLVLAYNDQPVFAAYHSTAAGPTEDAMHVWSLDLPYLKGVECPFDMNAPNYQWRSDVALTVLGYTVVASTQFDIEFSGLRLQFTGRGAGHGVGLCQWGAKELAERGYPAETILRYYYPGTELRELASLPRR